MAKIINADDWKFFRRNPKRFYRVRPATEIERVVASDFHFIGEDKPAAAYVRRDACGDINVVVARASADWDKMSLLSEQRCRGQFWSHAETQSDWLMKRPGINTGDRMFFHLNPDRSYRAREATENEIWQAEQTAPVFKEFQLVSFVHLDRNTGKISGVVLGNRKRRRDLDEFDEEKCRKIYEQHAQPPATPAGYGGNN